VHLLYGLGFNSLIAQGLSFHITASLATASGPDQSSHWMARNSNWLSAGHHTLGESRTRLAALTGLLGKASRPLGGQRFAKDSRERRICTTRYHAHSSLCTTLFLARPRTHVLTDGARSGDCSHFSLHISELSVQATLGGRQQRGSHNDTTKESASFSAEKRRAGIL
jgi:hypothetical protein